MSIIIDHYSSFTIIPGKGNPAGLVLDADKLSPKEMQEIAHYVGFNETTFVCQAQAEDADMRLRYFTPGFEMDLCGHGTIAALYALFTRHLLDQHNIPAQLQVETRAGLLPMEIHMDEGRPSIRMRQANAAFREFAGSHAALAEALGLSKTDLNLDLPIVYASTGTWTLLVPIRGLDIFEQMNPDNARFPALLPEMPRCSIHPFCLETYDPAAQMHGRHFSSPFAGTREDPVTGTASGAMGAYYLTYIQPQQQKIRLLVEQGHEIGRDGRVLVEAERSASGVQVSIEGTAVYERTIEMD